MQERGKGKKLLLDAGKDGIGEWRQPALDTENSIIAYFSPGLPPKAFT